MSAAKLRKIGGSVMVAIPPAVLRRLKLEAGATVEVEVEGERIAITSTLPRHYALAELLAEHEAMTHSDMADTSDERAWTLSKPMGRELI